MSGITENILEIPVLMDDLRESTEISKITAFAIMEPRDDSVRSDADSRIRNNQVAAGETAPRKKVNQSQGHHGDEKVMEVGAVHCSFSTSGLTVVDQW